MSHALCLLLLLVVKQSVPLKKAMVWSKRVTAATQLSFPRATLVAMPLT